MMHVDCTRIGDEMIELLMSIVFAYEMMMMMMIMMMESDDKAKKLFRSLPDIPWQPKLQSLPPTPHTSALYNETPVGG
jgi:hypothetical protein